MGGPGSNRWQGHRPKLTTDECTKLSISLILESLKDAAGTRSCTLMVRETKITGYILRTPTLLSLVLGSPCLQTIYLDRTEAAPGRVQYHFRCPSREMFGRCEQRVSALYCLPEGRRFACRHCQRLAYASTRRRKPAMARVPAETPPPQSAAPPAVSPDPWKGWRKRTDAF